MSDSGPLFQPLKSPRSCPVYVDTTEKSGKPVLFLIHGFMMSRAIWRENLRALSEQFQCVRIELLGHGRASAPNEPAAYQMASYIDAIDDIRHQTGAQSFAFCAHSFGAGIALSYGLERPEFTDGIVFTNSRSALGALKPKTSDLGRMKTALRTQGQTALKSLPAHPKNMKEIRPSVRKALIADAERLSPVGIANSMAVTARESELFDRLAGLTPPALLINGQRERGFQPSRDQLAAQHPHIEIRDMDAGHSVNAECPEAFNRAAIDFLLR